MMNEKNTFMPYVVERTAAGERTYDLPSRLLEDRIIFLTGEVNDASAKIQKYNGVNLTTCPLALFQFLDNFDQLTPKSTDLT